MIKGLGTDIVAVERIRNSIERHGDAFLRRIYTAAERATAQKRRDPAEFFAARWAAKEATAKALGCGMGEKCNWLDINIVNDAKGRPVLELSGLAEATAHAAGPVNLHLSISHERNFACATVIIENA